MKWAQIHHPEANKPAPKNDKAIALSMVEPPKPCAKATFRPDFGKRVLLTVDTEEEFDWNGPFTREEHGLSHVSAISRFQEFCEEIGAHPVYLVDWPIANDPLATEIIGDALNRGKADIGAQLHPWVNPPFREVLNPHNSFAGNLPADLEKAKFNALRDRIEEAFGKAPLIYRAGRYGLGPHSADILKAGGIKIDTSVRPLHDYSAQDGPNFMHHPATPYWVDAEHSLLEAPMTVLHCGAMREFGEKLQQSIAQFPPILGALARTRLLERIALTPEGVTVKEALGGLDLVLEADFSLTVLSFHSPSLVPGFTPYTRDESDVAKLYEWFRQVYAALETGGVRSASVDEVVAAALP